VDAFVGLFQAGVTVMVPVWLVLMALRLLEEDE
jgi:hypothetical protein